VLFSLVIPNNHATYALVLDDGCKIKKVASHSVAAIDREMLRSFIPLVHLVLPHVTSSVLELVNSAVQTKCRTKDCSRVILLHLAIDPVVFHGEWYLDPPSLVIVESLLMAGADVDSMDAVGNTPLHVAVINSKRVTSVTTRCLAGGDQSTSGARRTR